MLFKEGSLYMYGKHIKFHNESREISTLLNFRSFYTYILLKIVSNQ